MDTPLAEGMGFRDFSEEKGASVYRIRGLARPVVPGRPKSRGEHLEAGRKNAHKTKSRRDPVLAPRSSNDMEMGFAE